MERVTFTKAKFEQLKERKLAAVKEKMKGSILIPQEIKPISHAFFSPSCPCCSKEKAKEGC